MGQILGMAVEAFGAEFLGAEGAKVAGAGAKNLGKGEYIPREGGATKMPGGGGMPGNAGTHNGGASSLEKLWTLESAMRAVGTVDSQFPTFSHSISVAVAGGPKSDMRRIWQLCLATAFGRYRQAGMFGIQQGSLQATWDITGKACKVTISYVNSGVIGLALSVFNQSAAAAGSLGALGTGVFTAAKGLGLTSANPTVGDFLLAGPTQETVGGDMLSWLTADTILAATVAGAAGGGTWAYLGGRYVLQLSDRTSRNAAVLGAITAGKTAYLMAKAASYIKQRPPLPDTNRVITTAYKLNPNIQPPPPSGDGLSRTFPHVALVANALTSPCYLPEAPPQAIVRRKQPIFVNPAKPPKPPKTQDLNANQAVDTDATPTGSAAITEILSGYNSGVKDGYFPPPDYLKYLGGPTNPGTQ